MAFRKELVYEGKYDCESGATGADYLLKQDVTAIFAFNDMSAYGAYNRMNQKGIKIPEEISLIGYDDIFFRSFWMFRLPRCISRFTIWG